MNTTMKIQASGVNIYYGANQVLENIDFIAPANTITAIIGPSGCGKSTLLRSMNRTNELITKTKRTGSLLLDGREVNEYDPLDLRAKVGMIFQKPAVLPTTIYENIAVGPRLYGVRNKANLDEIVEQSLVGASLWKELKDRLHKRAEKLSGGQKQRLAIARALALEPEIILFDEATASLDPISTQKIEDLMHKLKDTKTIIIATHNMKQAARASDNTLFLMAEEGEPSCVVEFGPTELIFTNPKVEKTELYITGRFG
jgi:phosphate transport system ATP-binding protein